MNFLNTKCPICNAPSEYYLKAKPGSVLYTGERDSETSFCKAHAKQFKFKCIEAERDQVLRFFKNIVGTDTKETKIEYFQLSNSYMQELQEELAIIRRHVWDGGEWLEPIDPKDAYWAVIELNKSTWYERIWLVITNIIKYIFRAPLPPNPYVHYLYGKLQTLWSTSMGGSSHDSRNKRSKRLFRRI